MKVAPIETQPYRSLTICLEKRPEERLSRNQPQSTQWSHNTVWNKRCMEPRPGFALPQLWANSESAITTKTSPSYDVKDSDIRRAVTAVTAVPAATLPENAFLSALGPQRSERSHHKLDRWRKELWKSGNEICVRTKQLQFWIRCRPENQPSSKSWRRDAHCHRA